MERVRTKVVGRNRPCSFEVPSSTPLVAGRQRLGQPRAGNVNCGSEPGTVSAATVSSRRVRCLLCFAHRLGQPVVHLGARIALGRGGGGLAGFEGVVFGRVDFALGHVEEADEAPVAVADGFEDDGFGGAHDAAADAVADGERLAVALADEEGVDAVGVDADAFEFGGSDTAEEGFELGLVVWAAPVVLGLKRDVQVGEALDVGVVGAGEGGSGIVAAAAAGGEGEDESGEERGDEAEGGLCGRESRHGWHLGWSVEKGARNLAAIAKGSRYLFRGGLQAIEGGIRLIGAFAELVEEDQVGGVRDVARGAVAEDGANDAGMGGTEAVFVDGTSLATREDTRGGVGLDRDFGVRIGAAREAGAEDAHHGPIGAGVIAVEFPIRPRSG